MKLAIIALLVIARTAAADPDAGVDDASIDAEMVPVAPAIDPAIEPAVPVEVIETPPPPPPANNRGKWIAAGTLAGIYATVGTWAYFAWFHGANTAPFWVDDKWDDEKIGLHTYAGGADKFGHLWANYVLVRGTTELLVNGGWPKWQSSLVSAGLAELAFTASEIKDGFIWGFEVGDIVGNVSGAILAVIMENHPKLDRLFDFRLEYVPSAGYRDLLTHQPLQRAGGIDIAQDYDGQSYMLALHLKAIPELSAPNWLHWVRYVDVVAGFESRNYSPRNADDPYQTIYAGVTINMQHVLEQLFCDSTGRRVGNAIFEVLQTPDTTLRFAQASRTWIDPPPNVGE